MCPTCRAGEEEGGAGEGGRGGKATSVGTKRGTRGACAGKPWRHAAADIAEAGSSHFHWSMESAAHTVWEPLLVLCPQCPCHALSSLQGASCVLAHIMRESTNLSHSAARP